MCGEEMYVSGVLTAAVCLLRMRLSRRKSSWNRRKKPSCRLCIYKPQPRKPLLLWKRPTPLPPPPPLRTSPKHPLANFKGGRLRALARLRLWKRYDCGADVRDRESLE